MSYWLYATGEVEVRQLPANPPDGERVTDVLQLSPPEAVAYLAAFDDKVMAAALSLFVRMGGSS